MAFPLLAAAIPSIISGVSSLFGASKKRKAQQELQNYQRSLRLDPVTGQFGQIGVEDGNIDAGAFGDLQSMFSGGANQVLGGTDFGAGLPPEVASIQHAAVSHEPQRGSLPGRGKSETAAC